MLDSGLDYVPGSLDLVAGGAVGVKTDAVDGDEGEYDAATRTIRVRVGSGASGTAGGKVGVGETVTVRFRVKVLAQSGSIPNQGEIKGAGESGGPEKSWLTDADPLTPGAQPTMITVEECNTNADCPANKPFCDPTTKVCLPCSDDSHCTDPNAPACQPDGSCGECSSTNSVKCTGATPVCNTIKGECGACDPSLPNQCRTAPTGPVCKVDPNNDTFCGCDKDSDCGNLTSGKVCDVGKTDICIDGCRGTDGNGCPSGYQCTSTDSSIGQCVPSTGNPGTGAQDSGDDGSCGCRTPGSGTTPVGGSLALLLGAGVLAARRRRRRA